MGRFLHLTLSKGISLWRFWLYVNISCYSPLYGNCEVADTKCKQFKEERVYYKALNDCKIVGRVEEIDSSCIHSVSKYLLNIYVLTLFWDLGRRVNEQNRGYPPFWSFYSSRVESLGTIPKATPQTGPRVLLLSWGCKEHAEHRHIATAGKLPWAGSLG